MIIIGRIIMGFILLSLVIGVYSVAFTNITLHIEEINAIFIFIKSAMKSFDWLIPYNTQIYVFTTFITMEVGFFLIRIIKSINNFFQLKNQ
jgi:phage-related protein